MSGVVIPRALQGIVRTNRNYQASSRVTKGIPEKKFRNCFINLTANPNLPDSIQGSILDISQGTSQNERIGGKITVTNINLRARLVAYALSATSPVDTRGINARVLLVRDKQSNGGQCSITDVLQQSNNGTGNYTGVDCFRNMDNVDRFDIIYDKTFTLQPGAMLPITASTGGAVFSAKFIKINKKLADRIDYAGTTGTYTGLRSVSYTLFSICDHEVVAAFNTGLTGTMRIKYTDV